MDRGSKRRFCSQIAGFTSWPCHWYQFFLFVGGSYDEQRCTPQHPIDLYEAVIELQISLSDTVYGFIFVISITYWIHDFLVLAEPAIIEK